MTNLFTHDLFELGARADEIRRNKWDNRVFYVRNIHVNYTNVCTSQCTFCAFAKHEGDDGAYLMEIEDAVEYIAKNGPDAREIHIVGGLHPTKPFSYYTGMVKAINDAYPDAAVKGFSAVEIDYFAKIADLSIDAVLGELQDAGLVMMPGGGAEIFAGPVRSKICPEKIPADRWLEIHEIAHRRNILTNATMLYGHLESTDDRMDHLMRIRDLQEKTGGFQAFIPLAFHPDNTFLHGRMPATGVDDLKVVAASRIILDNVPHIKAYWVMLGEKVAQVALRFGADDLDGTIVRETITHAAGAKSREGMTEDDLKHLITSAGMIPVERNAFYEEVAVHG